MIRTLSRFIALTMLVGTAAAVDIVTNSDFTDVMPDDAATPVGWTLPKDSAWHATNEDGSSGQHALRYRSRQNQQTGPATQAVTAQPNSDYVLSVVMKSDGRIKPVVCVRVAGGRELVRIISAGAAQRWCPQAANFKTGTEATLVLELWADERQCQGYPGGAGTIVIDDVQILTTAEHQALVAEKKLSATYENVARGKPYTLSPRPGYGYCTDPADKTQLTDGQYSVGYFWTQKTTVGWSRSRPVVITLDLEEDCPIRGLSFNTAAGVAGVEWPITVLILVSVDGRAFHTAGDLVELSRDRAVPPQNGYAVHRLHTDSLKTHGRYVKLMIDPGGAYCFVDEIEVYRGEDAWLQLPLPGEEILYPMEYFTDNLFNAAFKRRIGLDLIQAQTAVRDAKLADDLHQRLKTQIVELTEDIGQLPEIEPKGFRAIFPLNEVHARVLGLHGAVRAAQGRRPVIAWKANRWDFLTPTELPDEPPQPNVAIVAMRGETRAGVLNLTNCTESAVTATLSFADLPGAPTPADVSVHQVEWTDTLEGTPVAAALPELTPTPAGYTIALPAGLTRQVWFSFRPEQTPAGRHNGRLLIAGVAQNPVSVPFSLRVLDVEFPQKPALHVGGWDYTDATAMYGAKPENREALIAHMRERYVDSPWATSSVMPYGTFDDAGRFTQPPDTTRFDTWVERWLDARRYCVFNAVSGSMAGSKIGEALFDVKVGNWIQFWVNHAQTRGIEPGQLVLLLVDEPHGNEQDKTIIAWARAVKAAAPGVVVWEDPTYRDPTEAMPEMMESADVLCPNRPMMLQQGQSFVDFYRQQKQAGRRLDLYSCSGPGRLLDPYAYHRLQAWSCFELGAESSFFWAFGDNGNGDSWNEYITPRTSYTPMFLNANSVTAGKHMEAIRESVGDFEYLTMLRRRVDELRAGNAKHPVLGQAQRLLATATERVLHAENVNDLTWKDPKDRSIADAVRVEIGIVLEKLK